jgi:two-component system nitrogen regulation response regulator GlnG
MRHFLHAAAKEIGGEAKWLDKPTEEFLRTLDWPGNVRQLENTCRWLTVMSPGQEIHLEDLPPELKEVTSTGGGGSDWLTPLRQWAEQRLNSGANAILDEAVPQFERLMIEAALKKSGGHRQDAAKLLGWGRNTITRKIKELEMEGKEVV